MDLALLLATAFVLGSIPTGFVIARAYGIDIRKHGSGNIGATNIARTIGKKAGAATLFLDALKGLLGAMLPYLIGSGDLDGAAALCGLAAILGHCYSPFLKFKGGKGVATSLGAFLLLAPTATLAAAAVFALCYYTWRYVSLGSIAAALTLPAVVAFRLTTSYNRETLLAACVTSAVVIWRHRANIKRLIAGEELKSSSKRAEKS